MTAVHKEKGGAVKNGVEKFTPPNSYLNFANVGRSGHKWYILGTSIILMAYLSGVVFALILYLTASLALGYDLFEVEETSSNPTWLPAWAELLVMISGFIPALIAVPFVTRYVHGRPWRSVITPFTKLNWGLIGRGILLWGIPAVALTAVVFLLVFNGVTWQYSASEFWPYALVGLTLIGIQVSAEELFFRGYLAQWANRTFQSIWFISIVTALPFGLAHWSNAQALGYGNNTISTVLSLSSYVLAGFTFAWVSYTSGTIELAIGAHYINNLLALLIFSTPDFPSAGPLFASEAPPAIIQFIYTVVLCGTFWFFTQRTRGTGRPLPLTPIAHGGNPTPPSPTPTPFPLANAYPFKPSTHHTPHFVYKNEGGAST